MPSSQVRVKWDAGDLAQRKRSRYEYSAQTLLWGSFVILFHIRWAPVFILFLNHLMSRPACCFHWIIEIQRMRKKKIGFQKPNLMVSYFFKTTSIGSLVVILKEDDDVERSGPREESGKRGQGFVFTGRNITFFLIKRVWEGKKNEEVGCVELQSETFALNRDSFN